MQRRTAGEARDPPPDDFSCIVLFYNPFIERHTLKHIFCFRFYCLYCGSVLTVQTNNQIVYLQSHGSELVTPKRLSRGRLEWVQLSAAHLCWSFSASLTPCVFACFRVQLDGEGTYECSVTGLVFEASERVVVRYSVLSWSKFGSFLRDSWRFAGPIFNVDTVHKDASVLKSIQFPHSVCLAGENISAFSDLRVTWLWLYLY